MSNKNFNIDTKQLENLDNALALYPRELNAAIRASLKTGSNFALKNSIQNYYNLSSKKLSGTHKITSHQLKEGEEAALVYEVIGRRLTPTHFKISPLRNLAQQPMVEIIKGSIKQTGPSKGADGKDKTPFVMFTKGKSGSHFNIFVGTGRPQAGNKNKEALRSYRTVSVPQMLGNELLAEDVTAAMLEAFENALMPQILKKTQLLQENITKE